MNTTDTVPGHDITTRYFPHSDWYYAAKGEKSAYQQVCSCGWEAPVVPMYSNKIRRDAAAAVTEHLEQATAGQAGVA